MDKLLEAVDPRWQFIRMLMQLCTSDVGDDQHVGGYVKRLLRPLNQVLPPMVPVDLVNRSCAVGNRHVNAHLQLGHLQEHAPVDAYGLA